jgi:hypothetical protein
MQSDLEWKKDLFSNLSKIYSEGRQVGEIKEKTFSKTATAELNNKRYSFITTGFFKPKTEILDESGKKLGVITYSNWMTKATITLDREVLFWKYDNLWNTEWRVFNKNGVQVKYKGSFSGGNIQSNTDDDLLLLSGLFISNYYREMLILIMFIVLLPVIF